MVNTVWLKTFLTLASLKNFTRTAEALYMTQPGVSQHIRKLESYYGVALLERSEKPFELTAFGEQVRQFAEDLFEKAQALEQRLSEDNPHRGVCRISSPGALAMRLYPNICQLQQQYPALAIHYEVAPNHLIISELLNNHIDMGLITQEMHEPELMTIAIDQEPLCLIAPANGNIHCYQDLLTLGVIMHPDAPYHLTQVLSANYALFHHCSDFPIRGTINQISLILEAVAAGNGFTVLPKSMVDTFHSPQKIRVIKQEVIVYETIYLAYKRRKPLEKRYLFLLKMLFKKDISLKPK